MSLSTQTYLLTLYVTYQQESSIRDLFTSNGWLFRKKGDGSTVGESEKDSTEEKSDEERKTVQAAGYRMAGDSDNDISDGNDDFEEDHENEIDETAHVPDTENFLLSTNQIKVETVTSGGDALTADFGDDTDEYLSEEESNTSKSRPKRKKTKQAVSSKKLKKGKSGKKVSTTKTQSSVSLLQKRSKSSKTTDKSPDAARRDVKVEVRAPASEISNLDLGADPDRTALEIELQETDDIDHFETVHKSLSPDEPFNPPSDVQETDGFSPSLGCYYCHDCGYTFQLQRWYKIHKWNGKCVYKCQVCSEVFTFRNISSYRTHMKTHKQEMEEIAELPDTNRQNMVEMIQADDDTVSFKTKYKSNTKRQSKTRCIKSIERQNNRTFVCHQCPKSFKSKYGLQLHVNGKHKMIFKYKCGVCHRGFNNLRQFKNHLSTHDEVLRETCGICQARFRYKAELLRHQQDKHGTKRIECNICGQRFMAFRSMRQHKQSIHQEKVFRCEKCSQPFKWRSSLKYHQDRCDGNME